MADVIPFVDINLGVLEKVDIYYTSAFGARWMFYGEPKEQDWKATVFAGSIVNNASSKRDNGASEAETKIDGIEYGFSVGKQVSEKALLYFTYGINSNSISPLIKAISNSGLVPIKDPTNLLT